MKTGTWQLATALLVFVALALHGCSKPSSDGDTEGAQRAADSSAASDGNAVVDSSASDAQGTSRRLVLVVPEGAEKLYDTLGNLSQMHADNQWIWWVVTAQTVYQASADGSKPYRVIGHSEGGAAQRFASDDEYIYWLSSYSVFRLRKDAPEGTEPDDLPLGRSFNWGAIALDGDYLYILDAIAYAFYRMPKQGGTVELIASPLNEQGDKGGGCRMTIHDGLAYLNYINDLFEVDLATGAIRHVADDLVNVSGMAAFDGYIYYFDGYNGQANAWRMAPRGTPEKLAEKGTFLARPPSHIQVDVARSAFYFVGGEGYDIMRMNVTDVSFVTVLPTSENEYTTGALATNDDYIYWSTLISSDAAVLRMKKP